MVSASLMSSPGALSCGNAGLALGLSPLGTNGTLNATPSGGFSFNSLGLGGPPSLSQGPAALRQQSSMDILLQASDLHRIRATESTDAATPTPVGFNPNPFKLPTVSAADLPSVLNCDPANAKETSDATLGLRAAGKSERELPVALSSVSTGFDVDMCQPIEAAAAASSPPTTTSLSPPGTLSSRKPNKPSCADLAVSSTQSEGTASEGHGSEPESLNDPSGMPIDDEPMPTLPVEITA